MSFLAPWALLFAAAIGVPLVLHLLRRRTGVRFDFPAVRYLLRAERERAREVKLRNLLLMLLRIGIVLAIAFAASRPIGPLPGFGHAPTAVAIVLDNSRSTSAAGVDGPVLGALLRAAREVVDAAASGDRLWIVTFDGEVTGGAPDALRDALSRTSALDGAGRPEVALRRAAALVRSSGIPAGRIVILTDGQATAWAGLDGSATDGVEVSVHRPAGDPPVNRFVAAVATEPAHWDPRGAVRASILGGDSTTWRVVLDGATAARGSALPGATILARVQPTTRGWIAGALELAPDELRGDDVRFFAAHVGDPPEVAVDNASGPFLRGAVEALVLSGRAVRGSAVLLASAERARRPGLLFAPADPLGVADANRALERAGIPWRFGAPREGPAPLRGGGLDGTVARQWYPLIATPSAAPSSASASTPGASAMVDTLVRVGGEPWAVAGDDYVLVASAATAAATDLTTRAAFVPWIDALLTQRLAQGIGAAVDAVPGATVRVPAAVDGLEAPDGAVTAIPGGAAARAATMDAPWVAGVYFWRRGAARAGALVVNGEPAESELTRLDADALADLLGADAAMADGAALARDTFAAGGRRALDGSFLILALVLLVAESLVARRVRLRPAAA